MGLVALQLEVLVFEGEQVVAVGDLEGGQGQGLAAELFPRLGIAEPLRGTARMIPGDPVGGVVARGDAELGLQQISELKAVPGIDIVGPLPPDAQKVTVYAAGIATASRDPVEAKKLIAFLASPDAADAVRKTGLEPPAP